MMVISTNGLRLSKHTPYCSLSRSQLSEFILNKKGDGNDGKGSQGPQG